MENIFKYAYFGKAYKTRDGRKALFMEHNLYDEYVLVVQDHKGYYCEIIKGETGRNFEEDPTDIVSEWQEEINEEVLCETALNFVVDFLNKNELSLVPYKNYNEIGDGTWNNNHFNCNDLTEAFEAGYRKALNK